MNDVLVHDLEIRILRSGRKNGSCQVDILGRNDSRARGRFRSPFTDDQVRDAILALDRGRFDSEPVRQFGASLFEALIRDDIKSVYDASGGNVETTGLRLVIDDARVARIPWELMLDPVVGVPFATRHRLVRGFTTSAEARPLAVLHPPIRVLVGDSSPTGVPRLEARLEVDDIQKALSPLDADGRIAVEVLPHVSEAALLDALRESAGSGEGGGPEPVHVFHWIGHGGIDPSTGTAALLFENEAGSPDIVDGERLATILSGSDIRLVFLNACDSAAPTAASPLRESSFEATAGIAEALLVSGIPGVIGMQAAVLDDRARQFARDFYESLADGRSIDSAILDARRLVKQGVNGSAADVGIPVCYLRAGPTNLMEARPRTRAERLGDRFGLLGRGAKWAIGVAAATVLGLIVVAAVNLAAGMLQPLPVMNGEFNVVVSEFLATGPDGQPVEDATAKALSGNLFEALRAEFAGLKPDLRVEIMPPTVAGRLGGTTPEDRSREAERLATATNGDMVIYGRLDPDGTSLQPEFYISPDFLPGAEELIGVFRLGTPIRSAADRGSAAVGIDLRRNLQLRTTAVTTFVVGLTWFASGDFSKAEGEFARAVGDAGWADRDGKEVVYLFRGTAAALQGRLEDARTGYQKALDLNPGYGRAMVGLAEVALHQSSGKCDPGTVDAAGLRSARDQYRSALVAPDQPPLSNVPAKAHFGIGRVDVCLSQALVEGAWVEAAGELEAVISEFDGGNTTLKDLAAEAHAELAIVRLPTAGNPDARAHYLAAADQYRAAIRLSSHRDRMAVFNDALGWVLERLGQDAEAAQAYDQAIELATDDAARATYREHRRTLDTKSSPSAWVAVGSVGNGRDRHGSMRGVDRPVDIGRYAPGVAGETAAQATGSGG